MAPLRIGYARCSNQGNFQETQRQALLPTTLDSGSAEVFDAYAAELGRPGGPSTPRPPGSYASRVRQYLAWLATADVDGDPLGEPAARDWAVRDRPPPRRRQPSHL